MNEKSLSSTVKSIAIGFLLIFFHLKINNIDLLADWIGYAMISRSVFTLSSKGVETSFLKPLSIVILILDFASWVLEIFGFGLLNEGFVLYIVEILLILLYTAFNFKLLSVLSSLATCEKRKRNLNILKYADATLHVLTITALFAVYVEILQYLSMIVLVAGLIVSALLCIELFLLSKTIKEIETEENIFPENEEPLY